MAEFREVLHEWARQQLDKRSPHSGPFTVTRVYFNYSPGVCSDVTFEDDETTVLIEFTHTNCKYVNWQGNQCTDQIWESIDSKTTVKMLNELLCVADQTA
jgi:predicted glycosyltransferase